ncbi:MULTISPECIES: bifunctional hydroxymethylpyrimidine kinase/phosphomethylpyrimidine kinase [unclassified Janthinobacterium]|uniref:bifunctional hydroxymethylpyrimidine kinase/phosphomethylpyrimidine kinase n=1 Tax=unclassified Janthinobacterium TaxID=2610881 RepID=UPI0004756FED|nr:MULTISPECIES: hydroxymethylpyrimidine/phosphomethylpyrimidine kinase [unclassified Janthinobacterium]MEC5159643.1 hydroxymethylpyrimidine/phosphomethylpyrimidine kinase [Janthinobacterium sp. CG_S6]
MQNQTSPLILSFGVSDPVGAIGIQADLAVFSAFGCHGLTVSTALLIGDTARVEDIQEVDPDWVSDQARVLLEDMAVAAIKIGAPFGVEHITAIAEIVSDYPDVPLILDPFTSALPEQGIDGEEMLTALRQLLVPQTTVLLLSQVELERLAETWRDPDPADTLRADVDYLLALGCEFVLVTGTPNPGQGEHALRANTLFGSDGVVRHDPWQPLAGSFSGAGATLSAALTALMARQGDGGCDAALALRAAQDYTAGALAHAQRFGMGKLVPNRLFRQLGLAA